MRILKEQISILLPQSRVLDCKSGIKERLTGVYQSIVEYQIVSNAQLPIIGQTLTAMLRSIYHLYLYF